MHPATAQILAYFAFAHLPPKLQEISQPFHELAERVAHELDGPEATVCLRKLLEAKDCAVRAALAPSGSESTVLARAIADVANGQRLGLGLSGPGSGGGTARY